MNIAFLIRFSKNGFRLNFRNGTHSTPNYGGKVIILVFHLQLENEIIKNMTTQNVFIEKNDNGKSFAVRSPYSDRFVKEAKKLAGKYKKPDWIFPLEVFNDVKKLCLEIYGEIGEGVKEAVTLRVMFPNGAEIINGALMIKNRSVARAYSRNSDVKFGDNIILRNGKIYSGGSVKNWKTIADRGTVIDILGFPKTLVDACIEEYKNYKFEIIGEEIDKESLKAEKEKIKARLEEIDQMLGG
jgi:hypothetical protein